MGFVSVGEKGGGVFNNISIYQKWLLTRINDSQLDCVNLILLLCGDEDMRRLEVVRECGCHPSLDKKNYS